MHHSALTTLSTLLLLTPAFGQRGDGPRESNAPQLQHFTVEQGTVASKTVREGEAGFTIFLPKGYADAANKDRKYPWVLWLPGFGGSGEFTERGGAEVLDRLRGEDKIAPIAFVVFKAPGRRGRSYYMNGEAAVDTEDLLTGDFLTELQTKYRLASEPKQRALMGISAGGFGALKIALRHPELFGAVAVHSAAVLPADPAELDEQRAGMLQRVLRSGISKEIGDPIDKAKWAAHMPMGLVAAKKPEELKGLQIYFDAGTADDYGFCPPNEQLSKRMTEAGHVHLFRKVEGGGHAFGSESMKDNLVHSLQFVSVALSGKNAVEAMSKKAEPAKVDAPKTDAPAGSK